jgi:hypothetical protein
MSDLVWTKHVEQRMAQRGISYNEAWDTIKYPYKSKQTGPGRYKLFKTYGTKEVVIVAQHQGGQWVIITGWVKDKNQHRRYTSGESLLTSIGRSLLFDLPSFLVKSLINWLRYISSNRR